MVPSAFDSMNENGPKLLQTFVVTNTTTMRKTNKTGRKTNRFRSMHARAVHLKNRNPTWPKVLKNSKIVSWKNSVREPCPYM